MFPIMRKLIDVPAADVNLSALQAHFHTHLHMLIYLIITTFCHTSVTNEIIKILTFTFTIITRLSDYRDDIPTKYFVRWGLDWFAARFHGDGEGMKSILVGTGRR
jgi:hypothetical protein